MDSVAQARDVLRDRVAPSATLLDVGCGAGHAWLGLRALDVSYHGIDSYARGIEIGRARLADAGLSPDRLRTLAIEDLPRDEQYDVVLSLNMLSYQPMFHLPLEAMARATREWLIVRSGFGPQTVIRFLPDPWLEPGHETTCAYFNVFSRDEAQAFLEREGFDVTWIADRRQAERFGGRPEEVAGIPLPAEFLVARRVRPVPSAESLLGPAIDEVRRFRANRERRARGE
jgi:SAM-dependent methyltransferase